MRTYATAALADAARSRLRGVSQRPSSNDVTVGATAEAERDGEDAKMGGSDDDDDEISDAGSFDDD